MSERDVLLASIASTIKTYRQGDLPEPTSMHVDKWIRQFKLADDVPFLREFDHVMKQTFLTKENFVHFVSNLLANEVLLGMSPTTYWARANFLQIQKKGQSQREMLSIFADGLMQQYGLDIAKCGRADGDYIYLDDLSFTGGRITTDLEAWIATAAPAKAVVRVVLIAFYKNGQKYHRKNRIKKAIEASGKDITITFWRLFELEDELPGYHSDLLWPTVIPPDPAVVAYAGSLKYPLKVRVPGGPLGMFSSEAGRQLLEREFLIAGVRIRSMTASPNDFIRPLGNNHFGVGFGSLFATYRNCPNNCPMAMYWGDPNATSGALHWYPLRNVSMTLLHLAS